MKGPALGPDMKALRRKRPGRRQGAFLGRALRMSLRFTARTFAARAWRALV
jgi:hypothetical protein